MRELIPVLPKDSFTRCIIKQSVGQLNAASQTVEQLRSFMNETASKLPEYPAVMAMKGVGPSLGPQLMAEIGNVTRFTHKEALTAFAGVDPGVNDSGDYSQKSLHDGRCQQVSVHLLWKGKRISCGSSHIKLTIRQQSFRSVLSL